MLKLLGIGPNTHFPREKVKGADDNSRTVEEPDAVKVCAVVRIERTANPVGWSSGQLTPR